MRTLLFMCHTGGLPAHTRTAIDLLQPILRETEAPHFVFAGDTPPADAPHAEFFDVTQADSALAFLRANYRHSGKTAREWQIVAMWRWFVLAEFMRQSGDQGPVVFLDSDMFMYDNPALILDRFDGEFGFGADCNPGICFFRSADTIRALCDLITSGMTDPELHARIVAALGRTLASYGGCLQEMGYIDYFCRQQRKAGVKVSRVNIPVPAGVYDYSVNFDQPDAPGFARDGIGKIVRFRDGLPYFTRNGKPVRALALHIHGTAKRRLERWAPDHCITRTL